MAAFLCSCGAHQDPSPPLASVRPAELVLRNGAVYTMDAQRSQASAVAVAGGKLVCVGRDSDVQPYVGPDTRVLDLQGQMVLPGLHDSHVHPVSAGLALSIQCNLLNLDSLQQMQERIVQYAAAHPDEAWITGGGWDPSVFPPEGPTHEMLDAVLPERPIYLIGADGHTGWVNSRALQMANITAATPDPPNGRIVRDAAGKPTGTLREAATALVSSIVPPPTREQFREAVRAGQAQASAFGITSLYDALASPDMLRAYQDLETSHELNVRVLAAQPTSPLGGPGQVARLAELRERYRGRLLRPEAAKIFMDGVVEGYTAALLEPYVGTQDYGQLNYTAATLNPLVKALDEAGFLLHIHAIGDRAVRGALDGIESLGVPPRWRPNIAHVQLIDPVDIPRFRQLGCVANIEARWASEDDIIRLLTQPRLGPERSSRLYPFGSLRDAGAVLVAGSDWPVTSLDPLEAIQIAVTRRPLDAGPGPAWLPAQVLTLQQILEAYTLNGAYGQHQEQVTGSLEVGKWADLVVFNRDLFQLPPEQIARARVVRTFLEGREVYTAPALAREAGPGRVRFPPAGTPFGCAPICSVGPSCWPPAPTTPTSPCPRFPLPWKRSSPSCASSMTTTGRADRAAPFPRPTTL